MVSPFKQTQVTSTSPPKLPRYEEFDSDETRLPTGIERVGYDADTQTYSYRGSDGGYWDGEEGNRYGELHRAGRPRPIQPLEPARKAWRYEDHDYFAPFFVIICVVLLLLFRFVDWTPTPPTCGEGFEVYRLGKGDTCWDIANSRGSTVDNLVSANTGLNCDKLIPDVQICAPVARSAEKGADAAVEF